MTGRSDHPDWLSEAPVHDGIGRKSVAQIHTDGGGRVIIVPPPGGGFSLDPDQADFFELAFQVAKAQAAYEQRQQP